MTAFSAPASMIWSPCLTAGMPPIYHDDAADGHGSFPMGCGAVEQWAAVDVADAGPGGSAADRYVEAARVGT